VTKQYVQNIALTEASPGKSIMITLLSVTYQPDNTRLITVLFAHVQNFNVYCK